MTIDAQGDEITLTSKEFELLRVLVREAGSVVTRDQLMREVWDVNWWGSTKTLDMHVSFLRRILLWFGLILRSFAIHAGSFGPVYRASGLSIVPTAMQ